MGIEQINLLRGLPYVSIQVQKSYVASAYPLHKHNVTFLSISCLAYLLYKY